MGESDTRSQFVLVPEDFNELESWGKQPPPESLHGPVRVIVQNKNVVDAQRYEEIKKAA